MSTLKNLIVYAIATNIILFSATASAELSSKSTSGEIKEFFRKTNSEADALNEGYHKEMLSAGWGTILDPNRLSNDTSLKQSKEIIANSKMIALFYKNKIINLSNYVTSEMDGVINSIKDTAVKTKLGNIKQSQKYTVLAWDLEISTIDTMGKIINLLDKNKVKWRINNNRIEFLDNSLKEAFVSNINEIQKTTQQQSEYTKRVYELTL